MRLFENFFYKKSASSAATADLTSSFVRSGRRANVKISVGAGCSGNVFACLPFPREKPILPADFIFLSGLGRKGISLIFLARHFPPPFVLPGQGRERKKERGGFYWHSCLEVEDLPPRFFPHFRGRVSIFPPPRYATTRQFSPY